MGELFNKNLHRLITFWSHTGFLLLSLNVMTSSANVCTAPPEWTVVYHAPGQFKGRGEFLRLMLEDAGVTDYMNSAENIYGSDGIMDAFRGELADVAKDKEEIPFPLMFPPAIWHRPKDGDQVLVNQVGACMIYLGDVLGYAPATVAERARANAILMNAVDYIAEGRSCFHPVNNHVSYKDQKEEGDKVSKQFTERRMKIFLHHFNKAVARAGSHKPVAGGPNITYADFALFHVLDATVFQFNTEFYEYAWDNTDVPALKEYYAWMKSRPNLEAYFQSDRCTPFAGDSMM